jgi:hypothetical protein
MQTWRVEVDRDCARLPSGTRFAIALENGTYAAMNATMTRGIIRVGIPNDDCNFTITVDNSECDRTVTFYPVINNESKGGFIVRPHQMARLRTFESMGRKLHFKSQATESGAKLVEATARKYNLDLADAIELCSKIKFNVKVSLPHYRCLTPDSGISTNTLFGRSSADAPFGVGMKPRGGTSSIFKNELFGGTVNRYVPQSNMYHESVVADGPDRADGRGVICLGEDSNQILPNAQAPTKDPRVDIEPFTVELVLREQFIPL